MTTLAPSMLTDQATVATVHVVPAPGVDPLTLPDLVKARLHERYDIDHVTVQVDAPAQGIVAHETSSAQTQS